MRARKHVLPITLALLATPSPLLTAQGAVEEALALVGAKIYPAPESSPVEDGTVVVAGGKVVAVGPRSLVKIPAGARRLDCSGLTITAGFQNSHVHFSEPKWTDAANLPASQLSEQLRQMLTRYGFTTVVDTGSHLENTVALRRRIASGEVEGPRILTAGVPLYPEQGIPYYLRETLPPEVLMLLAQPATPSEAESVVGTRIAEGADVIKLFTGSWVERGKVLPMQQEIASSAAAEAHRRHRLVFTHASNLAGAWKWRFRPASTFWPMPSTTRAA